MKQFFIILFPAILIANIGYAQTDIFLSDFKEYITPVKCKDSITHFLKDSSFLKLEIYNCMGEMKIKQFNRTGEILITGQYIASLDTLKEYLAVYNLGDVIGRIEVHNFFQPLKDGVWVYYQNGKEMRKEKYKQGMLIDKE